MLKNYLLVAVRSLSRQGGTTALNVGGLAIGLAACFLLVLFVQHELSFDQQHPLADQTYRVTYGVTEQESWLGDDPETRSANIAAGVKTILMDAMPADIADYIRLDFRSPYLSVDGVSRSVNGFATADAAILTTFDLPLIHGDPATALDDPQSVLLTETAAASWFGDENPVGRTIRYDDQADLTVTGVLRDLPTNQHLRFDYLVPITFVLFRPDMMDDLTNWNYQSYVVLAEGVTEADAEARMQVVFDEQFDYDEDGDSGYLADLEPVTSIHFETKTYGRAPVRDQRYVWAFSIIAGLILLIACINFMNLATARATKRAKEVGVRKSIGAGRGQLIGQFLGESIVQSALALALALVLANIARPHFANLVGGDIDLTFSPHIVALLVGIGLLTGILAGSYPAFYLSAFRPARVLKGEVARGRSATALRKSLIVAQFAVTVFLLVATGTVWMQLDYLQNQSLGFDQEQVVFASGARTVWTQYEAFEQAILADQRVQTMTRAGGLPGRVGTSRGYRWQGSTPDELVGDAMSTIFGDPTYLETFGLTLTDGRDFSADIASDETDAYILNEAAARVMGYDLDAGESPVGTMFRAWDREPGAVVGVVEDFHYASLHHAIEPVVINLSPDWYQAIAFRLAPGDVTGAMDHLADTWAAFAPGYEFDYVFLDDDFGRHYADEARLGTLFAVFAGLAIFVACLGLLGLSAYASAQRTKEIGVRKVLGASVPGLVALLSRDFVVLVAVAFAVAAPVAWWLMQRWLAEFAYRIELGPLVFLGAGAAALTLALVTVATQAYRTAAADPIKALRYE
ncbi:MAG: ABC transporter permease [Bacteroidota bacterium]